LQDYDEKFHDANNPTPTRPEPAANGFGPHSKLNAYNNWPWFYGPYTKNIQIFNCPSTPDELENLTGPEWGNDGNYGYNYDGLTRDVSTTSRIMAELTEPAEVFVFFDSGDPAPVTGSNTYINLLEALDLNLKVPGKNCGDPTWDNGYDRPEIGLRHFGRANMTFADGHAKSVNWTTLLTRKGDNVAPWMIKWADCPGGVCPPPVAGPGECFDPSKLKY
jgi:prepilin-type processing-associated H-X9-DG protein